MFSQTASRNTRLQRT